MSCDHLPRMRNIDIESRRHGSVGVLEVPSGARRCVLDLPGDDRRSRSLGTVAMPVVPGARLHRTTSSQSADKDAQAASETTRTSRVRSRAMNRISMSHQLTDTGGVSSVAHGRRRGGGPAVHRAAPMPHRDTAREQRILRR